MSKHSFFILIILSVFSIQLLGQSPVTIEKSARTQIINDREYYIHLVKKDHTLYSLSKVYGVSIDEIKFENPDSKNGLTLGEELKIPIKSRDALVSELYRNGDYNFFYHIVKRGEDFGRISSIYSVAKNNLVNSNSNLAEPLKVGQYVRIPIEANAEEKIELALESKTQSTVSSSKKIEIVQDIIYISRSGDNLYRLAIKFHVNVDEIKKINPGLRENFYPGREIRIPHSTSKLSFIKHRVLKRGKLSNIAKLYGLSHSSVLKINTNIRRNRVQTGQIIKIPAPYKLQNEQIVKVIVPEEVVDEAPVNRDSLRCFSDDKNLLKKYKIALMIPLFLENADSIKFDPEQPQLSDLSGTSFRFLSFYYGFMMAVDSLEKQGLKVDIHVYDVDRDVAKAIKVINEDELKEMDLIIGPFFINAFPAVAAFAKKYRIPIINPLSAQSAILNNNPFVYKIQPTNHFQMEEVYKLVGQNFSDSKIFVIDEYANQRSNYEIDRLLSEAVNSEIKIPNFDIYNLAIEKAVADTSLEEEEIHPLPLIKIEGNYISTEELELNIEDSTLLSNEIVIIRDSINQLRAFENEASVFRNNLVLINADDNVFALNILTELNILRDTFPSTVIGLPNWENFDNMDNEIFKNLNLHYFSSSYVNYADYDVKSFIREYRNRYLTEPENYAFVGFDISWYFLNALMNFGTNFDDCIEYFNPKLIRPGIKFRTTSRRDGYENYQWQLIKFQNYQLKKVSLQPTPN